MRARPLRPLRAVPREGRRCRVLLPARLCRRAAQLPARVRDSQRVPEQFGVPQRKVSGSVSGGVRRQRRVLGDKAQRGVPLPARIRG